MGVPPMEATRDELEGQGRHRHLVAARIPRVSEGLRTFDTWGPRMAGWMASEYLECVSINVLSLVICYIAIENHHFEWENSRFQWPFSIAM